MPLGEPPDRHVLWGLPSTPLAGRRLWRCHRTVDGAGHPRSMWWFASSPPGPEGGRFDLPTPNGACYTATSLAGAVVEAFQEHWGPGSVVPISVLAARTVSVAVVPDDAAPAANLSDRRTLARGVTGALWADRDRALTKRWAAALHGAGHQALHHGVQHDPGGRLRGVTLFDAAGSHPPWGLTWPTPSSSSATDPTVIATLASRDIRVTRHRPLLPVLDEHP